MLLCGSGDFAGLEGSPWELVMAQYPSTMALVRESPLVVSQYQQHSLEDYIRMTSGRDSWIDHKCLIYWKSGLNAAQQHNITYSSEASNVLLESIDVLQVVGGTGYESSVTLTQA